MYDPPRRSTEDDQALALPWLSEREPSMLIAEGPPSDAFDGLLSQWLATSVQPGEDVRGSAPMEGVAAGHATPVLQADPLQPLPLGGGGAIPDAPDAFEPFGSRLSSLLQLGPANGAYGHQAQNSWEQIPLFNPDFAAQRPPVPNMAPPSLTALPPREANATLREASSSPAPTGGTPQPQRSWSSGSGSEGGSKRIMPRFTSGMLQAAVSTAQWPISSLASSLGESSKAILSAPMDIAMTGARMGTGLVWGAVDGGVDGAKRAWRRRNQSEESRQKERARNRRAQKRFREKQKQRQLERRDTVMELKERLEALANEKTALASRNAILEKVFSMRARMDATVGENGPLDQSTVDFADVFAGEDMPTSVSLTLRSGPIELTREQLENLSWSDHVALWKDHVDQLAAELQATKHTGEEVTDRLLELIQECSTLSLSLCVINPLAMLRFQITRLDQPAQPSALGGPPLAPNPTPSPHSHWQYIEAAIGLDEAQRQNCYECRRVFFTQLGHILRQRAELHELAIRTCRAVCVDRPESGGVAEESQDLLEAMETLQKLQRNLREEQKLIVQRMIVNHQCSLRPRQAALKVVLSWPWYPDTLAIIEASAARAGSQPSTSSLLGLQTPKGELQ